MKTRQLDITGAIELLRPLGRVVTREQLIARGTPRSVIDRAIRDGVLIPYLPGTFVVAGEPITWMIRVIATFLYVERQSRRKWDVPAPRPLVAVTGIAAARLLGFSHIDAADPVPVLATNPQSRTRHALTAERPSLTEADIVDVEGVSVTSILWTVMELIAILLPSHITNIVADLARQGLLDLDVLAATAVRVPELRGHVEPFLAKLRLTDLAARSDAERRFLDALLAAGVPAPLVNHVLAMSPWPLELDFVWLGVRLNIELDGPHHLLEPQRRRDRNRDSWLKKRGWNVLRIKVVDFDKDPDAEVARVVTALTELGVM